LKLIIGLISVHNTKASKPLKPFQGLKRDLIRSHAPLIASKPLKPFQGLKHWARRCLNRLASCFKASKTLSGIETRCQIATTMRSQSLQSL